MGPPVVMWLTGRHRFSLGTSWAVVLEGLPLIRAQAKVGHGLRDGVNVEERGKKNQIVLHSRADESRLPNWTWEPRGEADAGVGHQDLVDGS
jgi:hypothetical protein